jgi:uncharacterized protein
MEQVFSHIFSPIRTEIPEVNGLAVVSSDGRILANDWNNSGVDSGKLGAIASALLGLGKKSVEILADGDFQQIVLQSTASVVSVFSAGRFGVLIVSMSAKGNMGLLNIHARQKSAELSRILEAQFSATTF